MKTLGYYLDAFPSKLREQPVAGIAVTTVDQDGNILVTACGLSHATRMRIFRPEIVDREADVEIKTDDEGHPI